MTKTEKLTRYIARRYERLRPSTHSAMMWRFWMIRATLPGVRRWWYQARNDEYYQ